MDVSIKASGEPSKFDIFDSGLTLLALHSACLALAFTASESESISKTFNLILMMAGFASGAVLAVLAAYYGTINAKALAPQLMGGSSRSDKAEPEILTHPNAGPDDVRATIAGERGDKGGLPSMQVTTPVALPAPGRSAAIVTGVVTMLLLVVALLLLQGARQNVRDADGNAEQANVRMSNASRTLKDLVDARHARGEQAADRMAQTGEGLSEATRASLQKTPAELTAEHKAREATRAAGEAKDNASEKVDRNRYWQAWLIIGLTALVLGPIPFAWIAPSPLVSTIRGLLVLGSLLAFVLGVGGALLPLAAQAVSKGVEQATETRVELPGATPRPDGPTAPVEPSREPVGPIPVVEPGRIQPPIEDVIPPDIPPHDPDIDELRIDIAQLRTDMTAALSRPVHVSMAPPEIRIEAPSKTAEPLPPIELTVIGAQGEDGAPGSPGPVRECRWDFQRFWPRTCTWVPAPTHLPAEAPRTSF